MSTNTNELSDEDELLMELRKKNIKAFAKLYKMYSGDLLILAFSILNDNSLSIKTVDKLFENLWEEEKFELVQPPIHKFLYEELRKICKPGI